MTIAELQSRRDEILADLDNPDFSGDVEARIAEAEQVATDIAAHNAQAARATAARAALSSATPEQVRTVQTSHSVAQPEQRGPADHAESLVQSQALANFRTNGMKGRISIDVPGLTIRSLTEQRAPIDSTVTSGGAFANPARPAIVPLTNADRVGRVADLLDRQTTGDNTVEYVRDTTAAGGGAAAEVAEGAAKPEAGYTFEIVTDSVRTVAHWVQITRQAASDNAQLMGYIRGRLTYGLEYRLDGQILNGNGTAPNLRGILNTSGINTVAPAGAEARVISIRKAITTCQLDEYSPTGVVLSPSDWELVELSVDSNGMFRVSPSVSNALAPRIWGLNVVSTSAIAAGTALVGDFRMGATLWDREQAQILMSDSHASTFTSNVLTLLAELRVALSVWRPSAFCKITFNGTI